jgi:hypothetical protein
MQEESKSPEPKKMRVRRCAVKYFPNFVIQREVEGSREVTLQFSQRDPSTSLEMTCQQRERTIHAYILLNRGSHYAGWIA